jgi:hypothetical protein
MKKKLALAKLPLPKFRPDKDAAEYFDGHSVAGVWDQLPEARQAQPSAASAKTIRQNHVREIAVTKWSGINRRQAKPS